MLETNVRPKVLTDMLLLLGRFELKKNGHKLTPHSSKHKNAHRSHDRSS